MPKRRITVLGSTGSIGTQGLEVIAQHSDKFEIVGLSAGKNVELLAEQIRKFNPQKVSVIDEKSAAVLKQNLGSTDTKIVVGENASADIAGLSCDVVLNGITGAAGLPATISALKSGAKLALANKESLVIGGKLVLDIAGENQIIPVDSEHSALAQCLRGEDKSQIKKLILTASGGPFRGKSKSELEKVTLEETLKHPTWVMGQVVTINSATLMNKGLEVIEAHLLFGIDFQNIEVVVHPQSIVHSLVEFVDGSTMAQASPPNMKVPIALALSWPDRLQEISPAIDWTKSASWDFETVDVNIFPALNVARKAGLAAGTAPAVMNAANEICVQAFIERKLSFLSIVEIVNKVLENHLLSSEFIANKELNLDKLFASDKKARFDTQQLISEATS
ncbi:MAG: 1-deoxy-D-xylulose-5-phosphate reductoisomerase [Candidatus Nanopelagicales bacterium]|nr:1-deoxy-D-xylulose-5-phosphate reductoisomerase [Candidatus Nanopelagicales bacterium]